MIFLALVKLQPKRKQQSKRCLGPSTRIRIFLKTRLFYPFWVSVHTKTAFSVTENEAFLKHSPEWIFFKTPFSFCRRDERKRIFSKTPTPQHRFTTYQSMRTDLWGSCKSILIVCFFVEIRTAKFEYSSVFVWTGIFLKALPVWTRIFFIRIKQDAFSKISGYVWTRP